MRIVYVIGTRPNIVKMAPVLAALQRRLPDTDHVLVHAGQHYDRLMSEALLEDLDMAAPDHMLRVGSASHTQQTARVMARLEGVLVSTHPDLVVVAGDVNTTLGAALVAAQLRVPLAHVESGLRSFDRTMPEELNRILTDHAADHLFVHCADAETNLLREGIEQDRISFTGNTMIDSLLAIEPRFRSAEVAARLGHTPRGYLLVTLHRPALVDGPLLTTAVAQLRHVSRELPVVFPVHPRTRPLLSGLDPGPRVHLTDPLTYVDFMSLQADARAVLTDSGGVQEEATFLGVPCFTLRDNTERPITVTAGTNTLLGLDPGRIADILPALERSAPTAGGPPALWDGRAGERVADVLTQAISRAGERTGVH